MRSTICAAPQRRGRSRSLIDGEITKVDTPAGKITIKHGPIKKLGMDEGMTMVFKAPGPGDAQGRESRRPRAGSTPDDVNGQLTLTKIVKGK